MKLINLQIVFLLVSIAYTCPLLSQERTWRDVTGTFQVQAELLSVSDDKVVLKKHNGNVIRVPLSKLSPADLDYLKRVNDEFGHLAGDAVLRGVGSIFRHEVRETDVAGRFGGEELMVVLSHSDCLGGRVLGERIRTDTRHARSHLRAGRRGVQPELAQTAGGDVL